MAYKKYLHLSDGMTIGRLHQDGDGPWVLALLNESELVLTENVLIDQTSVAEERLIEVLEAVHGLTAAGKG